MTALIVLLFFAFFVGLDYFLNYRKAAATTPATAKALSDAAPAPVEEPVWVSGYELPEALHYHRGHTWARVVSPDTVAVGVDDFARRLIGRATKVRIPRVGEWLRQGSKGADIHAGDHKAAVVSPVEGEVVEVNRAIRRDPGIVSRDPYGAGWLYKVRSAALATNLRNLLSGSLARHWTTDARQQLELRLMALSGSVLQDGGEPAPDFADHLEPDDWRSLAETFLLTR